MKPVIVVGIVLLFILGATASAYAQDPIHKAGRGMVNVLTGWFELPRQVDLGRQEDNPVKGMGFGIIRGLGLTLLRSGVGLYEVLTFPIPFPKNFASPYDQWFEISDYTWE